METSATENFELDEKGQAFIANYTESLKKAMEVARDSAMSDLNNYLRDYGCEVLRTNTLFAAQAIVADVVSGKHWLGKSWAIDLTHEAQAIREYLWKNYADVIVKAQLVAKDEEIARLKQSFNDFRRF